MFIIAFVIYMYIYIYIYIYICIRLNKDIRADNEGAPYLPAAASSSASHS